MTIRDMSQGCWPVMLGLMLSGIPCSAAEPASDKWAGLNDSRVSIEFVITPPGGQATKGQAKVIFSNRYAVSATYDPDGRYGENWGDVILYDLDAMAWYDVGLDKWIDLEACKRWEAASIRKAESSLASEKDANVRGFIESMIKPRFAVEKTDGRIKLSNSHLTYFIAPTPGVAPLQLERFIVYDKLNAYQKAITQRQVPPTAQLAVDDVLIKEQAFPGQLTTMIKTGGGMLVARTDAKIEPFDASDAELLKTALAPLGR